MIITHSMEVCHVQNLDTNSQGQGHNSNCVLCLDVFTTFVYYKKNQMIITHSMKLRHAQYLVILFHGQGHFFT